MEREECETLWKHFWLVTLHMRRIEKRLKQCIKDQILDWYFRTEHSEVDHLAL